LKKNGAGTKKSSSGRGAKNPAAVIASRIGKGLLTALLVCIIIVCVVVAAVSLYVMNFVKPYSVSLSESDLKTDEHQCIRPTPPAKIPCLPRVSGTENRIWVPLSGTPKNLRNAIISTEDMRFNEHEGRRFPPHGIFLCEYDFPFQQ
jgi:membrane peptidoglycan carboxypeptidase